MQAIIIFTPQIDGHYLEYIHHIHESNFKDPKKQYIFAVPESFEKKKKLLYWSIQENVAFDYIADDISKRCYCSGRKNFIYSAKLLSSYLKKYDAEGAIVLTLPYILPFILMYLPFWHKCRISGIIYYIYPCDTTKQSWFNKIRTSISYWLMVHCRSIRNVYILNSQKWSDYFNQKYKTDKFKFLTDPVACTDIINAVDCRKELCIPDDNTIILHFGSMSRLKGSIEILKAIDIESEKLRKFTFVFAGRVTNPIKDDFYKIYNKVKDKSSIIVYDDFCSYESVESLLKTCDAILIPYINSCQSSGVVAHAAFHKKPLIVLKNGFVGDIVNSYKMGICMDDNKPSTIVKALYDIKTFKNNNTAEYLQSHTIDEFCKVLLEV